MLGHGSLIDVVFAEGTDQQAKNGGGGASPSVQTPVGNAAGEVSKEDSTEDRRDRQGCDRPVGLRGVCHKAPCPDDIVNKQGKCCEQAAVLYRSLACRIALCQLLCVVLTGGGLD